MSSGDEATPIVKPWGDRWCLRRGLLSGPVALVYSRFDESTRLSVRAEYLASIEPWRERGSRLWVRSSSDLGRAWGLSLMADIARHPHFSPRS